MKRSLGWNMRKPKAKRMLRGRATNFRNRMKPKAKNYKKRGKFT